MLVLYIAFQSVIYLSFLYRDLYNLPTTRLKYLGIILCFLYVFYHLIKTKRSKLYLSLLIKAATLLADYFLLVINKNYEIGILIFCLVELAYGYEINKLKSLNWRLLIIISLGIVLRIINLFSLQNFLALFSFVNLSYNVIESATKKDLITSLGFLFFWLCDACVGLYNMEVLVGFSGYLMWLFYLPSQVLISLGECKNEN